LYKASLLFKTRKKPSIENYATTLVEGCDRTFSVLFRPLARDRFWFRVKDCETKPVMLICEHVEKIPVPSYTPFKS